MSFRNCGGCTLADCHDRQRCMRDEVERKERRRRREQDDAAKHAEQSEMSKAYDRHYAAKAKIDAAAQALRDVIGDPTCAGELGFRFVEPAAEVYERLEKASAAIVQRWN